MLFDVRTKGLRLKRFIFVSVLVLMCGCAKDYPVSVPNLPAPPSANGGWLGTAQGSFTIYLWIQEDRNYIKGSACLRSVAGGPKSTGGLVGNENFPDFSASIYIYGYEQVDITGKFLSPTIIDARLNHSGFDNLRVVFQKQ